MLERSFLFLTVLTLSFKRHRSYLTYSPVSFFTMKYFTEFLKIVLQACRLLSLQILHKKCVFVLKIPHKSVVLVLNGLPSLPAAGGCDPFRFLLTVWRASLVSPPGSSSPPSAAGEQPWGTGWRPETQHPVVGSQTGRSGA